MHLIKQMIIIMIVIILIACGGGGGNPGTPMVSAPSTDPAPSADVKAEAIPSLSLSVLDKDKKEVTSVPTFFRGERAVEAQIPNVCRGWLV